MKKNVKKLAVRLFKSKAFHPLRTHIKKHTFLIVLYHDISPELFDTHLQYLGNNYAFISLEKVEAIYTAKYCIIPENGVLINFDDGLKENYDLLPIIKKHDIRPTVFLTAGLVDTRRKIWTYLFDKDDVADKKLLKTLTQVSNKEKDVQLRETMGHYFEKEYENRQILNSDEIQAMSAWVDFQSHGVTHAVMPKCSDEELQYELEHAKKILEEISGQRCFAIAYPNGQWGKREIKAARSAGYLIGREATRRGLNDCRTNPLTLKRISVRPDDSLADLERSILIAELNYLMERISALGKSLSDV